MSKDIRIPVEWIHELSEELECKGWVWQPGETKVWESRFGNKLHVTRVQGLNQDGEPFDSLDFEYNPGD